MSATPLSCPKCGGSELRVAHPFKQRVNPLVFIFGGFLLSVLWSGSRKQEMRCCQCDTFFEQSTRTSKVLSVVLLVVVLLIVLGVLAQVFGWAE
jgi:hypothetical protein